MEELPQIADRITVLRDGRVVETRRGREFPPDDIIRAMVGRPLDAHFPGARPVAARRTGRARRARSCARTRRSRDVSFSVRAGEIVGLAGLVGAGRTEIVRAIAGADVPDRRRDRDRRQTRCASASPHDGIAAGIAFITEDRKAQGLVLGMTVRENITLAHLAQFVNREHLIIAFARARRARAG